MSNDNYQKGFLYIATGSGFQSEAILSAQRLKKVMPAANVSIVTDNHINCGVFDDELIVDDPHYSFRDQIQYLSLSPYQKTIYLDTDIYIYEPISEIYDLLDQFDIAAATAQGGKSWEVKGIPKTFPEYNSGVVAYRNNTQFKDFCKEWEENYDALEEAENSQNQPSMRKTLFETDLRIANLPREYNCMFRQPGHVTDTVKVFHGRLIDIDGPGAEMEHDPKIAIEKINYPGLDNEKRVFTQRHRLKVHSNKPNLLLRGYNSLQQNGLKYTFCRAAQYISRWL